MLVKWDMVVLNNGLHSKLMKMGLPFYSRSKYAIESPSFNKKDVGPQLSGNHSTAKGDMPIK